MIHVAALAVADAGALSSGADIARNACEGMLADARALITGAADELVIALEDGGVIASGGGDGSSGDGSSSDVVVRVWYGAGTAMNAFGVQPPDSWRRIAPLVTHPPAAPTAAGEDPGPANDAGSDRDGGEERGGSEPVDGREVGAAAYRRDVRGLVRTRGRGDVRVRRPQRGEVSVRAGLRAPSRGVVPVRRRRRFVGSL